VEHDTGRMRADLTQSQKKVSQLEAEKSKLVAKLREREDQLVRLREQVEAHKELFRLKQAENFSGPHSLQHPISTNSNAQSAHTNFGVS